MYQVKYHKLVQGDFKNVSKKDQLRIIKAINKKLKKNPEHFGKPLKAELKGYFRLRVDMYRVIYKIEKEEIIVYVIHIGLRKNLLAYTEAARRLGML